MANLGDELDAMDLRPLLEALLHKLDGISNMLRAYPEAKLALVVAINRLALLTQTESMTQQQLQQNQRLPSTPASSMI